MQSSLDVRRIPVDDELSVPTGSGPSGLAPSLWGIMSHSLDLLQYGFQVPGPQSRMT